MSDFTIRSESVDVEQIMKQIRQRILEKRGADYTEEQIRELASVRLEKFLDPNNLRSDLLEQFRKSRPATHSEPPAITPPYTAEQADVFATHRGSVRFLRKLFAPILKMMFNANTLHQVLHTQAQFNVDLLKREARRKIEFDRARAEWNSLYYEVLHNLVLETTRMGIEVQNLRMKLESLSSRLDFSERRVRALEGVVQYRPEVVDRGVDEERSSVATGSTGSTSSAGSTVAGSFEGFVPGGAQQQGDGSGKKRRRRRRGRRSGGQGQGQGGFGAQGGGPAFGASGGNQPAGPDNGEAYEAGEDGPDDDGPDDMEGGGFDAAPASQDVEQLRHDRPEPMEEEAPRAQAELPPAIPETLKTPEPGDDDVQ